MTLSHASLGSLVADALATPCHWCYDRENLHPDYGLLDHYQAARNPHPGSILWRSEYHALNARGDIIRDQAVFWGQRGIHYRWWRQLPPGGRRGFHPCGGKWH